MKSFQHCPVCGKLLDWEPPQNWEPLQERQGILFCANGPCPSHAANEGAQGTTPEEAHKQLCLLVERELEERESV